VSEARLKATGGSERIRRLVTNRVAEQARRLEGQRQRLVALSPDSVLTRGYSITRDATSGAILRSASQTQLDKEVTIQLGEGNIAARVEEVRQ
ncbi:MAG TPA: exodeoxyribonuclease VII large subunit, partial [Candidatus Dormibacteraeota bacterium]|nr:exodeoxyribonuclease VII large subunit [Candidatus Dormibacteraeota bacterium]